MLPFRAANLPALLGQMLNATPPSPALQGDVPEAGAAVILRALAPASAARFQSAPEMRQAIRESE
jgi:hypothetical protein